MGIFVLLKNILLPVMVGMCFLVITVLASIVLYTV